MTVQTKAIIATFLTPPALLSFFFRIGKLFGEVDIYGAITRGAAYFFLSIVIVGEIGIVLGLIFFAWFGILTGRERR